MRVVSRLQDGRTTVTLLSSTVVRLDCVSRRPPATGVWPGRPGQASSRFEAWAPPGKQQPWRSDARSLGRRPALCCNDRLATGASSPNPSSASPATGPGKFAPDAGRSLASAGPPRLRSEENGPRLQPVLMVSSLYLPHGRGPLPSPHPTPHRTAHDGALRVLPRGRTREEPSRSC